MPIIAHNMLSQFTNRQLNITDKNKSKSSEKLSSGFRINRASDDAAGLAISEKLRWQVRGLNRASQNIQDGVSICQVADGALSEVHDMLQRMNELAIQASNDTNSQQDRQAIQKELNELLSEIDRIGNDTEFNTRKLFHGWTTDVLDANGNPVRLCDIPITDFHLRNISDVTLGDGALYEGSRNYLNLSAILTEKKYTDTNFDLIYGKGATSHSSVKINYLDDNGDAITLIKDLDDCKYTVDTTAAGGLRYIRTYKITEDIKLEQQIAILPHTGTSQYYQFSYLCRNNSGKDIDLSFMFNADSAYNNQDRVEGYFINGQKINNFSIYTTDNDYLSQNSPYIHNRDVFQNNEGFSIIDEDNALPFSVNVKWDNNSIFSPDTVSVGDYFNNTYDWDYYDNLYSNLGGNTENEDLAFSLIYNRSIQKNENRMFARFQYGFTQTSTDTNLAGLPISYNQSSKVHVDMMDLWIQSGATPYNGIWLSIGEMNTGILGIRGIKVTTYEKAQTAISSVQEAIDIISKQRTAIGVQQNRLEHAKEIAENICENTQAAESHIRDTDMASEIVNQSKHSILQQTGQSMLAQANQLPHVVLQLLQ